MKNLTIIALIVIVTGCTDAQIASTNLSKASDMFEVDRRIVFYNVITGNYVLTVEGK